MALPSTDLVGRALAGLGLVALGSFVYRLFRVRTLVRSVAERGDIVTMPHSFLFGHLPIMAKIMSKYPPGTAGQYMFPDLVELYPELADQGAVYVDVCPIFPPMIVVFDPDMISQFTQDRSLPKHELLRDQFRPFTQCLDVVSQEGQEWKTWRSIFNPGFSAKNLSAIMPLLLEEIDEFREWLKTTARSGQAVPLESQAIKLTADLIGRASLGVQIGLQQSDSRFFRALSSQLRCLISDYSPQSIPKILNPFRPLAIWNNNRIMRNYLLPHIERTISERLNPDTDSTGPKTVISLAVQSYLASTPGTAKSPGKIDPRFLDVLIAQLKVFMLAGYDTTAATLTFAYHLLYSHLLEDTAFRAMGNELQMIITQSKSTEIRSFSDVFLSTLSAVRKEHAAVLGPDPSSTRDLIAQSPQLLNQLPYTTAVLKETQRLFPPAASIRAQPDSDTTFVLTHPATRKAFPTKGFMLLDSHFALHRNPRVWGERANEFVPERFLAREGEPLHVGRKNAFRAFGMGPRSCLGQELALLELKAVLAMTVRQFDLQAVLLDGKAEEVLGERVYQTQGPGQPTPHPKGGLVVRVRERVEKVEE